MSDTNAVADAIEVHGIPGPERNLVAAAHPCEGAEFHSPRPRVTQRYDFGDKAVVLCGTCRDNLSVLLHLIESNPELDWKVYREFGNKTRAIAKHVTGSA